MIKLFIGGFPLDMDELELVQMIAPYADVLTIKLVRDRANKRCKGYGFIEVTDNTHAQNAILHLNGMTIGERELSLNIVEQEAAKPVPVYRKVERAGAPNKVRRPRRPGL